MKVLLVANTLPPSDVSGVGEQVLQLAAGLRELGHEVRVLGRRGGGDGSGGAADGARGPKLLFPLTIGSALARAVRSFDPDIVQVHEGDVGLALRSLRRRRGGARRPLLVALQQVSYVEEKSSTRPLVFDGRVLGQPGAAELRFRRWKAPLQIALGRWTTRAADLVLAPSAATAAELVRDYAADAPEVLPNVTSELGALSVSSVVVPFNELFAGASSVPSFLFVGRLRIRKGVEVLLEAMVELARSAGSGATLVVAGDGEHRAALEWRAQELGLGERVRFLGRVSTVQVRALLANAVALVVPSIYEGMPLVVLEAMSTGLPVVASRVSGIPEVVLDGETGWLVPPEDPPALARALASVVDDREEAARRGAAGRKRVDACYRPRHAARLWESIVRARLESKSTENSA